MVSEFGDETLGQDSKGGMQDLLGAFSSQESFDERSARIREKHG